MKKKVIIAIVALVLVAAALAGGIALGKNMGNTTIKPQGGSDVQENIIPTDLVVLVTALERYTEADLRKMDIEVEISSKAMAFDKELKLYNGSLEGKEITNIRIDNFDIYICDNRLYLEDFTDIEISAGDLQKIEDIDIKQIIGFACKIFEEGEFSVDETEGKKIFSIALSETQIAALAEETMSDYDALKAAILNGRMEIVLEDKQLSEINICCSGEMELLTVPVPLEFTVEIDTEAQNNTTIKVPQGIWEKINSN